MAGALQRDTLQETTATRELRGQSRETAAGVVSSRGGVRPG